MRTGSPTIWTRTPAGSETQLTVGPDRNPRFSADGQYVYFLRDDGVWRVDSRGGTATSVISRMPGLVEVDPSPDGRWLVYQRFERASAEDGSRRLFGILGVAATTPSASPTELLRTQDAQLASARWSPDGTEIAVVRRITGQSESEVVVVDAATAAHRVFEAIDGTYGALTWNGDGRTLLVTETKMTTEAYAPGASGRVVVLDSQTGRRRTLFPQSNLLGLFWDALSNSRIDVMGPGQLVFDRLEMRQTLQELHLDGVPHPVQDLTHGTSLDRQPAYSPDGRDVVFTSNRTGNLDLHLVTTSDRRLHPLTIDPAQDWDPGFTPDGRQLLWSSDRSGHLEIWIADVGEDSTGTPVLSNYRQLSSDGVDAENPTMTADGEWVVYSSSNPEHPGIWKVRPDGSDAEVLISATRKLIPEVSPNGRYALFIDDDRYRNRSTIRVVEIETGRLDRFRIAIDDIRDMQNANISRGRARWASDDRIVFVGHDHEARTVGIFEQAFEPGQDTSGTRRLLVASDPGSGRLTESFDISPDGSRILVSFGSYTRNVMIASGVPGIEPPRTSRR
jgi:Tol biopolymer transport system component